MCPDRAWHRQWLRSYLPRPRRLQPRRLRQQACDIDVIILLCLIGSIGLCNRIDFARLVHYLLPAGWLYLEATTAHCVDLHFAGRGNSLVDRLKLASELVVDRAQAGLVRVSRLACSLRPDDTGVLVEDTVLLSRRLHQRRCWDPVHNLMQPVVGDEIRALADRRAIRDGARDDPRILVAVGRDGFPAVAIASA
ncbi:MAG: hypothetical protein ACRYG8_37665 [Janthinobacterium lividum]